MCDFDLMSYTYNLIWLIVYVIFMDAVDIVKLRRGSGKDRQGMAPKAKGLKA